MGFIAFKFIFQKKGSTRIIRGPFGFRIETDEDAGDGKDGRTVYKENTRTQPAAKRSIMLGKPWTCVCGNTVKPGETKCPSCGKSSDQAIRDADIVDGSVDDGDVDDPLGDNMIDLD